MYKLSVIRTLPLLEQLIFEHAGRKGLIQIDDDMQGEGLVPTPKRGTENNQTTPPHHTKRRAVHHGGHCNGSIAFRI